MKSVVLTLILVVTALNVCSQKRVNTTRRNLRQNTHAATTGNTYANSNETRAFVPTDSALILTGFDKPLSSMHESLFAINRTDFNIVALCLKITYLDRKDRQLHSRNLRVDTDIPAQQTRRIEFPSFDRQKSFYYIKSKKPRSQASPFNVVISIDSAIYVPIVSEASPLQCR